MGEEWRVEHVHVRQRPRDEAGPSTSHHRPADEAGPSTSGHGGIRLDFESTPAGLETLGGGSQFQHSGPSRPPGTVRVSDVALYISRMFSADLQAPPPWVYELQEGQEFASITDIQLEIIQIYSAAQLPCPSWLYELPRLGL